MEFVDLSRYLPVCNPKTLPFSELKGMDPVILTADLALYQDKKNLNRARKLAEEGMEVVRIRRNPPKINYVDRPDFPRRVLFEMTSRCNYYCRMCPQQNLKRERMDTDPKLYKKVVDEIDKYGVESFFIYHIGESLLHPNFKELLEHVSSKKNLGLTWMSTNGELFGEEHIRAVLKSNLTWINYSAHSVTEETYFKVIGKNTFNAVQKNLENFYRLKGSDGLPRKPYLHCQMIEQEPTKHEVDGFIKKHYKRAEVVSINMLEFANLPNNRYGMQQRDRKKLRSCLRIDRNDCFIFSNGTVTLCDAAYNGEILLGNINKNTLHEIWIGKKRRDLLDLNKQGRMSEIEFCRNCTDYDI